MSKRKIDESELKEGGSDTPIRVKDSSGKHKSKKSKRDYEAGDHDEVTVVEHTVHEHVHRPKHSSSSSSAASSTSSSSSSSNRADHASGLTPKKGKHPALSSSPDKTPSNRSHSFSFAHEQTAEPVILGL
jgi:hypothetical protein